MPFAEKPGYIEIIPAPPGRTCVFQLVPMQRGPDDALRTRCATDSPGYSRLIRAFDGNITRHVPAMLARSERTAIMPYFDPGGCSREVPTSLAPTLRRDMTVRRVAADYPQTRALFRRYGEECDRAVFGHLEPLDRFAQRRGVEVERLLNELAAATGLAVDWNARRDERLHGPFVLTALVLALTLGAGWGAYLLFAIGFQRTFDAAPSAYIIAHGAAQLWGFVAIFIIGVALRYLSMITRRRAPTAKARAALLAVLVAGVLGSFSWSLAPTTLRAFGPAGALALLAGSLTYFAIVVHFVRGKLAETWARFVLAAAGWLVVWACWTLGLRIAAGANGPSVYSSDERQIIMDLALFGLAMGSVYGFGRRLLPGFLAIDQPHARLLTMTLYLHNAALLALLAGRCTQTASLIMTGLCGIGCGAMAYVAGLRGLGALSGNPRPFAPERGYPFLRRYIQLAFAWLLISLIAFAAIAVIEIRTGIEVPHPIHGAVRHALTVGFLLTLILGVGQRLFPVLGHTLLAWPRLIVPIFLLIGVGNLLRVASEVAATWWTPAFLVMPFSAILEFAALSLFTINAVRTIWPAPDPLIRHGQVTALSRLSVLLTEHPWIEDQLMSWGMDYVRKAQQVPSELTIGTFAAKNGFDPVETIMRINAELRRAIERQR